MMLEISDVEFDLMYKTLMTKAQCYFTLFKMIFSRLSKQAT